MSASGLTLSETVLLERIAKLSEAANAVAVDGLYGHMLGLQLRHEPHEVARMFKDAITVYMDEILTSGGAEAAHQYAVIFAKAFGPYLLRNKP